MNMGSKPKTALMFTLMVFLQLVYAASAAAFSVDVKNILYTDGSGRAINYNFSAASSGPPPGIIGIPDNFVTKVGTDAHFAFGDSGMPNMNLTVTLDTVNSIATLATTSEGLAILSGASSGSPPAPANSWTYAVKLQNFQASLDPMHPHHDLSIGLANPAASAPQPTLGINWYPPGDMYPNGLLIITPRIHNFGTGDTPWEGRPDTIASFSLADSLELRIINTGTQVSFAYKKNNDEWKVLASSYDITLFGGVFNSLPENHPYIYLFRSSGGGAGATISFMGWVKTAGGLPINGATVNAFNQSQQLISTTQTLSDGSFTIAGIPASTTFRLVIPAPALTTYVPVLSKWMNWNANIQALRPFVLFTQTEYLNFSNTSGTGMIIGRVALESNPDSFLAGATVVAQEWTAGNPPTLGATYPVTYNSTTGTTGADGIYMVKNVPDGKMVQLVATLTGYTFAFNGAVIPAQSNFVSEESFFATATQPPSPGITLSAPFAVTSLTGGSGTVNVTAGSGVAWTAQSSATGWLTITSGASGSGSGPINFNAAANTGAARIGIITINAGTAGSQQFVVTQGGTAISSPVVGTWASAWLQYEITPNVWYTEATRAVFNADGTGALVGIKNDGINDPGKRIKQFGNNFVYSVAVNVDGSYGITINNGGGAPPMTLRVVLSDNGNVAVMDGSDQPSWISLKTLLRIDTAKTYSAADLNGEYYFLGFERNVDNVIDPPGGNGHYMAISGIQNFNGAGTYSYSGRANSVKIDGANVIWDDPGKTGQPYTVSATGGVAAGGVAFQGAVSANGRVAGGTGSYLSNNWLGYFFLKKGDKTYSTADIAGKWAMVSLGQDTEPGKGINFYSSIGTITCTSAGVCTYKARNRESKAPNTTTIDTGSFNVTIAADGSFGASFGGPAYSGAIGNDGNTLIINTSFDSAKTWNREVAIAVRASNIGDLAGGEAPPPTGNLLSNGDFSGGLNGWIVNPAFGNWNPLALDMEGMINLHPTVSGFKGSIIHQNLNISAIAEKSFAISIKLARPSITQSGKSIALWLTYLDSAGNLQRVKALNPDNASITGTSKSTATTVSGTWTAPVGAQKLVKFEIVKEDYGQFYLASASLWAEGTTSGPLPNITNTSALSGAYGSSLTITGQNFGTVQGRVLIGGSSAGVTVTSWTNTSITVGVASPSRGGNITVIADGVETNVDRTFQVTSPYFTVDIVNPSLKVIKGQTAEFLLKSAFHNNFTTEGITFQLQGGDAATLSGITSFTPVPIKGEGGVAMRINTQNLPAGTYTANVVAVTGAQTVPVGTLNLQVVTVKNITFSDFYVYDHNQAKSFFTGGTITKQGRVYIDAQIIGSDDQPVNDGEALTVTSNNSSVMGVFKRAFGYEFFAILNGNATITAATPDGFQKTANVTVSVADPKVTSISVTPSTISNTQTGDISFGATGTVPPDWVGYENSGMMNFETDFLNKLVRTDNQVTSSFKLTKTPSDLGTVMLYASTGNNSAYTPLTIINDPASGMLKCYIRNFDGMPTHGMVTFAFFDQDGVYKFSRSVYLYFSLGPIPIGNIPPGSYKIAYSHGNQMFWPQWYPNASTFAEAQLVGPFTAGGEIGDIYFFDVPQPSGTTVTLPVTSVTLPTNGAATGSFAVTATPNARWAVLSNDSWIRVTQGVGVGSGTVAYAVDANQGATQRTGTISIGGNTFTVNQLGTDGPFMGDINGDKVVNLADAILAMRALAGMNPSGVRANYATSGADVNGDGRVGLHEVLYILQHLAGLRQ